MAPQAIEQATKASDKVIRKGGGSRVSEEVLSTGGTAENISTVTAPKAMGKATRASSKISSKGGEATVTAQLLKQALASDKVLSTGGTAEAISKVLNTVEDPTAWWRRIYDSWVKRGIQESTPLLTYARVKAHYEWVHLPRNPWAHTVGDGQRMWS